MKQGPRESITNSTKITPDMNLGHTDTGSKKELFYSCDTLGKIRGAVCILWFEDFQTV